MNWPSFYLLTMAGLDSLMHKLPSRGRIRRQIMGSEFNKNIAIVNSMITKEKSFPAETHVLQWVLVWKFRS
jgi:hypothetical protein